MTDSVRATKETCGLAEILQSAAELVLDAVNIK